MSVDHEFKGHPSVFAPLARGDKTFEFRKDDRGGYHVGQTICVRCYDPEVGYHDAPPVMRRITNILRPGEFGLQDGYCILSLAPVSSPAPAAPVDEIDQGASPAGSGHPSPTEPLAGLGPAGGSPSRDAWRPIETAPKDETWILACGHNSGFVKPIVVRYFMNGWTTWREYGDHVEPTHWMPLPAPPAHSRHVNWYRRLDAPPRASDERTECENRVAGRGRQAASAVGAAEAPHPIPSPPVDGGEIGKLVEKYAAAKAMFGIAWREGAAADIQQYRAALMNSARSALHAALAAREREVASAAYRAGWGSVNGLRRPDKREEMLAAYLETLSPGTSAGEAREAVDAIGTAIRQLQVMDRTAGVDGPEAHVEVLSRAVEAALATLRATRTTSTGA